MNTLKTLFLLLVISAFLVSCSKKEQTGAAPPQAAVPVVV